MMHQKVLKILVNGCVLRIKDCRSPMRAMKGLMFSSLRGIDGALIRGSSIWTPFCKPLLLIFLDKKYRIIRTMEAKPWHSYSCREATYCLEINTALFKERIKSVEIENIQ